MTFNTFPNSNATLIPPWNYKRGKEVNKYVEHYAKIQQIKQEEAFQVQGSDLLIWNRILSPRICTCQGGASSIDLNPAVTDDIRPNIITKQKKQTIDSVSVTDEPITFKAKKQFNAILQAGALADLGPLVDSLYDTAEQDNILANTQHANVKNSIVQSSILEEAFLRQKANLGLDYTDYVNCPICFNTGHTEAYQPHKGLRLILDASDTYSMDLHKARINNQSAPYKITFLSHSDSYVTWTLQLPKYFKAVSIKAYNLATESTSVQLSFKAPNDNSFSPLNLVNLQARNGMNNNDLTIKCAVNANNITEQQKLLDLAISHVEIVVLYNDVFDKGELPLLTILEQLDHQELYLRTRIVLAPSITSLNRNDLICENKYGLLWQVIDVEKSYTVGGTQTQLRAEIRLVQNSEKLYSLAMFERKLNSVKPDLYNK